MVSPFLKNGEGISSSSWWIPSVLRDPPVVAARLRFEVIVLDEGRAVGEGRKGMEGEEMKRLRASLVPFEAGRGLAKLETLIGESMTIDRLEKDAGEEGPADFRFVEEEVEAVEVEGAGLFSEERVSPEAREARLCIDLEASRRRREVGGVTLMGVLSSDIKCKEGEEERRGNGIEVVVLSRTRDQCQHPGIPWVEGKKMNVPSSTLIKRSSRSHTNPLRNARRPLRLRRLLVLLLLQLALLLLPFFLDQPSHRNCFLFHLQLSVRLFNCLHAVPQFRLLLQNRFLALDDSGFSLQDVLLSQRDLFISSSKISGAV